MSHPIDHHHPGPMRTCRTCQSSDPLPVGVFDGPQPCPTCGHDTSTTPTHNVRACAACDDAAQVGAYAPCQTSAELPAGATIDDDPEAFAAELVAEYAEAIERRRDRAEEARAGGRYIRRHVVPVGPRDRAELVRRDRRDRLYRLNATQADALLPVPLRHTPIGAAGLAALEASAAQQTPSA